MKTTSSRRDAPAQRVLIIGADGADPTLLGRLMDAGQLPHLARLREEGLSGALQTTYPAVSPVAWTSLLTGCWPAKHGVLDFIIKAPGGYRPTLGLYEIIQAGSTYRSRRSAPTIAEMLSARGRRSYLLHVPATFPAPAIRGGVLAGLGAPDLLGTFGVPALYVSDRAALPADIRERPEVETLAAEPDGAWSGSLAGPAGEQLPFRLRRIGAGMALTLPQAEVGLATEIWSDWLPAQFGGAAGICRFCLLRADDVIILYRTPLHHAPAAPGAPLCWPADFAARLAARLGPFATASFPMEQAGYQNGLLPAGPFLAGAYAAWEQQARIAETLIAADDWALLVTHLFTADALQHFFWPDVEGVIAAGYRWLDGIVGRLRQRAGEHTAVLVVSDHGTAPVEQWLHLNRWLEQAGYLRRAAGGGVDWAATRAFCLGYGGVYLNVMGREPRGVIEPGRPYEQERAALIAALRTLRDPHTGALLVQDALPREAWHSGPHVRHAPDIVLMLRPGVGLARADARGDAPAAGEILEPNRGRWRAGHEGPHAPDAVAGVCLAAGPGLPRGRLDAARIVDIAPTVLRLLGETPPAGLDGQPFI
jgi:predicted AlkP superfamily phosphohydrolase/phosphomutase